MTSLAVFRCPSCNAPVPLVETSHVTCAHCSSEVALPAEHVARAGSLRTAIEARRRAEPIWRRLSTGHGRQSRVAAWLALAVLPALGSVIANVIDPPLGGPAVLAYVALPLVVPGLALWARSATAHALLAREAISLGAVRATSDAPPACRNCAAALPPAGEHDLATTCPYCTADNLLAAPPAGELARVATRERASLGEALHAVRVRARVVTVAIVLSALLVVGLGAGALAVLTIRL